MPTLQAAPHAASKTSKIPGESGCRIAITKPRTITIIYDGLVVGPRKIVGKTKIPVQNDTKGVVDGLPDAITVELTPEQRSMADKTVIRRDTRSRALLRRKEITQHKIETVGGAFTLGQVCQVMGCVSRQAIERRVREGRLLAVPGPSNRRVYPAVQFGSDGEVVPGIKEVLHALPMVNHWEVLKFLVTSDISLGNRKPIDLLREGSIEPVVQSAANLINQ